MKLLFWDSNDPLDVFDNPNCFFDVDGRGKRREPFDPGYVAWFPPGYQPPRPKPKRKRRRSLSSPAATPNTTHTTAMSFQFIIVPNPNNATRPFRARARLGPQVGENELLDAVATDSGVSRADIEKVIQSLSKVTIGFMRNTRPLAHVLGLFRAIPTMSGSFATNEPSADEIKAGVGFSLVVGPEADAAMTDGLTVEKVGEEGAIKPEIQNLVLSPGGQADMYSTIAAMKCSGDHFRGSGPNQSWPAAFLLDANLANPIPLTVFMCSQTELLIGPPPAGTTGTKRLKLVAGWDSDIEFIYPVPLTLAP